MTVEAGGTQPLSYSWYHGTQPIPGATSPSLTIPNLGVGHAGVYQAVVSNGYGSTSSSPATLTVVDTTPPVITAFPADRNLAANTTCQAALPNLTPEVGYYDCSGGVTVTQTPAAGTLRGLGNHAVTLSLKDAFNNPTNRTVVVTIVDQTAPVIASPPAPQVVDADSSCHAAVPDLTQTVAAQDCNGPITISQTPTAGTLVGLGQTTVALSIRDAANNLTNTTVVLTVRDVTPPTVTGCAPDQILFATDRSCFPA
jgi:hypothetical protein